MAISDVITHPCQLNANWNEWLKGSFLSNTFTLIELMAYGKVSASASEATWQTVFQVTDLIVAHQAPVIAVDGDVATITTVGVAPLVDAFSLEEFSFTDTEPKIGTMDFTFDVPWFKSAGRNPEVTALQNIISMANLASDSTTRTVPCMWVLRTGRWTCSIDRYDDFGQPVLSVSDYGGTALGSAESVSRFPFFSTGITYDDDLMSFKVTTEDYMGLFNRFKAGYGQAFDLSYGFISTYEGAQFILNAPSPSVSGDRDKWTDATYRLQMRTSMYWNLADYLDQITSFGGLAPIKTSIGKLVSGDGFSTITGNDMQLHTLLYWWAAIRRVKILPNSQSSITDPPYYFTEGDSIAETDGKVSVSQLMSSPVIEDISAQFDAVASSVTAVTNPYEAADSTIKDTLELTYEDLAIGRRIYLEKPFFAYSDGYGCNTTNGYCGFIPCAVPGVDLGTLPANISAGTAAVGLLSYSDSVAGPWPFYIQVRPIGPYCLVIEGYGWFFKQQTEMPKTLYKITSASPLTKEQYDVSSKNILLLMTYFETSSTNYDFRESLGIASASDKGLFVADDDTSDGITISNPLCGSLVTAKECQRAALGFPYRPTEGISWTSRSNPFYRVGMIVRVPYYGKFVKVMLTSIDSSHGSKWTADYKGWVIGYTDEVTEDWSPTNCVMDIIQSDSDKLIYANFQWTAGMSVSDFRNTEVRYEIYQASPDFTGERLVSSIYDSTSSCVALDSLTMNDVFTIRIFVFGEEWKSAMTFQWSVSFDNRTKNYRKLGSFKSGEPRLFHVGE